MLVGVGSRFVVSLIACCTRLLAHLIACCTRLLAHLIACAIKSFKNYFLHNEVVQLLVISAHEVCGSAQQSVWFCIRSMQCLRNRELISAHEVCGSAQQSVWFCTAECVVLHSRVCGSAQQSVWFCTTKLCSAVNGGTQC